LQEKHPEVRHEVARDAIVWIVEQDLHLPISPGGINRSLFIYAELRKGTRGREG